VNRKIADWLDENLLRVEKPARYIGRELNAVVKDWDLVRTRVALVFPEVYDLGMSNFGMAILYDILNKQPDVLAERVYTPWPDMESLMRKDRVPVYGLETYHPLGEFDIIGFSLPYEQVYTNMLTTLDLGGIPLRSAERDESYPLVIAGGSACYNPEPIHAFVDACFIGEGEEGILDIVRVYREWKGSGEPKAALLRALAGVPGVYVPSLYDVRYNQDGTIAAIEPEEGAAMPVVKRIVPILPPPVTDFVVPWLDVVHNRGVVEISRGCTRGCRFCQAGVVFRPVRERPLQEVLDAVDEILRKTGYEEIAFLSLSPSDYRYVGELVKAVAEKYRDKHISISLPSLRIESFSVELMEMLESTGRRTGFTFAPEAATDRLRNVINKPIPTEELLAVAEEVFSRGWTTLKLYFMIGLPGQTMEDVEGIVDLARRVREIGRKYVGRRTQVRLTVSTFVPKPQTPFQWVPLARPEEIREQVDLLRRKLRGGGFHLNWNRPEETAFEALLSRGDRRLSGAIQLAWERGARFDGWAEHFDWELWLGALRDVGLDPEWYLYRERGLDEVLPWDVVNAGVDKSFLKAEYLNSKEGLLLPDCREHCYSCGIIRHFHRLRRNTPDEAWRCPPIGKGKKRQPVSPGPVPVVPESAEKAEEKA